MKRVLVFFASMMLCGLGAAGARAQTDDAAEEAPDDGSSTEGPGAADGGAADTGASGTGTADTGASGTGTTDTGASGTGTADTGASDTGTGDTGAGDTGTGDTGASGTGPSGEPAPSGAGGSAGAPLVVNVHSGRGGRDEDEEDEEAEEEEGEPSPFDPHERPGDDLYHFGLFARGIFAPQFIQNLFVTGGANHLNVGAGAFFNYRRDGFNIMAEVWWAGFYGQAPFHGLNETDFETEWIESELEVMFVSFAFMWSVPITSWLAFEIGLGLGFGGVFGDLWRTEAYPDPNSSSGWTPCRAPGAPNAAYCDPPEPVGEGSYQRLDGQSEPYNFSGGVPPLWFWLDVPRVALRIKPIRQLQIRIDGGFAAYAFHFGGSLAVGF